MNFGFIKSDFIPPKAEIAKIYYGDCFLKNFLHNKIRSYWKGGEGGYFHRESGAVNLQKNQGGKNMELATVDWSSFSPEERVQTMIRLVGKTVFISPEPFRRGTRKAGPFLGPFIGKTMEVVGIKRNIHGDFFMFENEGEMLFVRADVTQPV